MNVEVEFSSLVGVHKLSGAEYTSYPDGSNGIAFILDGVTYEGIEDPDDGWRSMMKCFFISNREIKNKFPEEEVMVLMEDGDREILRIVNKETSKTILEVGTDHSDDWYPCFISDWRPENLTANNV